METRANGSPAVLSSIRASLPGTNVATHLEPREDERSYDDYAYDAHPPRPSGSGVG